MSGTKQLVAILFSDIVGYTALMGNDEERALRILTENRKIHFDCVGSYNGKLLKEMGDGMLCKFGSAREAVSCAIEIQKRAVNLGAKVRIGIHLGDVTTHGDDILGNDVNIASRIQEVADPGGIYISDTVFTAIRAIESLEIRELGAYPLKNVAYKVKMYAILDTHLPRPDLQRLRTKTSSGGSGIFVFLVAAVAFVGIVVGFAIYQNSKSPREIESLIVLPINDLTGDTEGATYTTAVLDGINNEVGKILGLRVPSTRTALSLSNSDQSLMEVAEELRIQSALEVSLLKFGDSVSLRLKLYELNEEEKQLWSSEITRPKREVMRLYGEVSNQVARQIGRELPAFQLASYRLVEPSAYDAYVKGMQHWYRLTPEDLNQALKYFELAKDIDPDYAPAYAGIAMVWGGRMQQGILPGKENGPKVDSLIQKALSLDSTLVEVTYTQALHNTWWNWNFDVAEKAFEQTLSLNPQHAAAHAYYSHFLHFVGRTSEANSHIATALNLDPVNPLFKALYAMHLNFARKFDVAIQEMNETLQNAPNDPVALSTLRSAYHNIGDSTMAFETFVRSYDARNDSIAVAALRSGYAEGGYGASLVFLAELLIERSSTKYVAPWQIGTLYTRAGKKELALQYLKEAYDQHDVNVPYLLVDPIFDNLRDTEQFREITSSIGY